MKTLEKKRLVDANNVAECMNELSLVRGLNHRLICNGHFAFQDACLLYLVLDIAMASDLRVNIGLVKLMKTHFTLEQIQYIMGSVILALEYCHSQNVLHRDIKPDNILLEERGTFMLADFGISKKVDDATNPTTCRSTSGTPGYAAPEIKAKVGHGVPSECYSCGILLQELVCLLEVPQVPPKLLLPSEATDWCTAEMKDFVAEATRVDPLVRMGSKNMVSEVKEDAPLCAPILPSVRPISPPFSLLPLTSPPNTRFACADGRRQGAPFVRRLPL